MKLFKLLQCYVRDSSREVLIVFKETKLETKLFEAFLTHHTFDKESSYQLIVDIFTRFFLEVNGRQLTLEKAGVKILNGYVSLIPILCKQYKEFMTVNLTHPHSQQI